MELSEISDWIKWFLIIFVAIIMAWEKAKRWHYRRAGKDRRTPNPNLETKVTKLCAAFEAHEKNDEKRTDEIKSEVGHLREQQGRHAVTLGVLKSRMNSR